MCKTTIKSKQEQPGGTGMCKTTIKSKQEQPVGTGMPPWHTQAFIGALLALSAKNLPSPESLHKTATFDTLTNRVFPDFLSLQTVGAIRLLIAASIWGLLFWMAFISDGWMLHTVYKPETKLIRSSIKVTGIRTLFPFTSWSWILLGFSFSFNGMIAIQVDRGAEDDFQPWMLRAALVLFEIAAPFALLVSSVVRYAIWPAVLAAGQPHELGCFRNQMMHNVNAVYALTEMSLLGGIPMTFSHISIPCFIGCCYVLFAWSSAYFLGKDGTAPGPQYQYFFLDTTLGKVTTISLAVLLTILMASFAMFVGIEAFVSWLGGSVITNTMCVVLISSLVCKVKA
jgi:hypothetical protein